MSDDHPPYSQSYIITWTALSVLVTLILFGMLVFGDRLLGAGHIVWNLLRWLSSPII